MTQLNLAPAWHEDRVIFDDLEIGEIALDLDDQDPQDVVEWALETFNDRIAIVTALQADGMAVLDMAAKIKPDVRVITVDTGRLPQETYDFIDEVRAHYPKTQWDVLSPDNAEVEAMVQRLTALLGGELSVQSELGRGSTFRVVIPVVGPPARVTGRHAALERPAASVG